MDVREARRDLDRACIRVSNEWGEDRKQAARRGGGGRSGSGGGIEHAYACKWKALQCGLAAEVTQAPRGETQFITAH